MSKLTSRKFLSALAGILIGVATIISGETTQGTALVIASIIGYLVAEGYVDAKAVAQVVETIDETKDLLDDKESEETND